MHYYLGVHRFTLLLRMNSEMGWVLIIVRHNILIICLFKGIPRMGSDRAPRKLFEIMKNAKRDLKVMVFDTKFGQRFSCLGDNDICKFTINTSQNALLSQYLHFQ